MVDLCLDKYWTDQCLEEPTSELQKKLRAKLDEDMTTERRKLREEIYEKGAADIERLQPIFDQAYG